MYSTKEKTERKTIDWDDLASKIYPDLPVRRERERREQPEQRPYETLLGRIARLDSPEYDTDKPDAKRGQMYAASGFGTFGSGSDPAGSFEDQMSKAEKAQADAERQFNSNPRFAYMRGIVDSYIQGAKSTLVNVPSNDPRWRRLEALERRHNKKIEESSRRMGQ